jgi:4-diphosphocytidyl-2-C-methyl-D-erythritol kinase
LPAAAPPGLVANAPAKVNLTLRVLGRRPDGYHELESLVVFAAASDRLTFAPGRELMLEVEGPRAAHAGANADNLVLKAARALATRVPGLRLGAFHLEKTLPVAAGLGGGSADAAAALRLLAQANNLTPDDTRLYEAARATGADVPVCLDPRPRVMTGIGEKLSAPLSLPELAAVLVNPGVAVPTKDVFARWAAAEPIAALDPAALNAASDLDRLLPLLVARPNDLEAPAITLAPVIADVLAALRAQNGCRLARMSGSGATCFALFSSAADAESADKMLSAQHSTWWVCATTFWLMNTGF